MLTTHVSAVAEREVPGFQQDAEALVEYEGVRLDTNDPEKLIPFVDQMLFWLRL